MEELRRILAEELNIFFDTETRLDRERLEYTEKKSKTNQRLAGLQHKARQPRLATEVDVEPDTKTRKRTEGAAADDRVMNGNSSSARADDGPTSLSASA